MTTFKFYGTEESIKKWKDVVSGVGGKDCSKVAVTGKTIKRHTFSVTLDEAVIKTLMKFHWYKDSGNGMPWNHCIVFECK